MTDAIVKIKEAESLITPALPKTVEFGSLLATIEVEMTRDLSLRQVEPNSLFWSFVHAAELGLRIGKVHEEAYVLAFRNNRGEKIGQFVLGYKGMIKLAYQHPLVHLVDANVVRAKDTFDYDGGSANRLVWKPNLMEARGRPVCAFCKVLVGQTGDSAQWKLRVCTFEEINQAKSSSPRSDKKDSPWQRTPEAMWKKTAIRRAMGDVPRSEVYMRAETIEDAYERGALDEIVPPVRVVQAPKQGQAQQVKRQEEVLDGEMEEDPAF